MSSVISLLLTNTVSRVRLCYPYDWRGFDGTKKKTSVVVRLYGIGSQTLYNKSARSATAPRYKVQGVATLAHAPRRGTYCILSGRAGDFFKTFLTSVRGIVESWKYICWFPNYPDARFRAFLPHNIAGVTHRLPIEIIPRRCLSTLCFHEDKNTQSSRFLKLYCAQDDLGVKKVLALSKNPSK